MRERSMRERTGREAGQLVKARHHESTAAVPPLLARGEKGDLKGDDAWQAVVLELLRRALPINSVGVRGHQAPYVMRDTSAKASRALSDLMQSDTKMSKRM